MLYSSQVLDRVEKEIDSLPIANQGRIWASIETICSGDFLSVHIKTLKAKLRELIVGDYRIIFFIQGKIIYFIHFFIKKTNKTPKRDLEYAEKLFKLITKT